MNCNSDRIQQLYLRANGGGAPSVSFCSLVLLLFARHRVAGRQLDDQNQSETKNNTHHGYTIHNILVQIY